ncbi:MAG TPA: hypothetical protein VM012_02230 [Flavitalea sp.]|nr:hypothetical protein [Flavitalea sp.]
MDIYRGSSEVKEESGDRVKPGKLKAVTENNSNSLNKIRKPDDFFHTCFVIVNVRWVWGMGYKV